MGVMGMCAHEGVGVGVCMRVSLGVRERYRVHVCTGKQGTNRKEIQTSTHSVQHTTHNTTPHNKTHNTPPPPPHHLVPESHSSGP